MIAPRTVIVDPLNSLPVNNPNPILPIIPILTPIITSAKPNN